MSDGEASGGPAPACAGRAPSTCAVLLGTLALLGGCRDDRPRPQPPPPEPAVVAVRTGVASHYAARFSGRRTASGERYDPEALTAAHRTLPFGTRVRVRRAPRGARAIGPSVIVRINDRGPYEEGRLIDLSGAAARRLGMLGTIARVRVEVLADAASSPSRSASRSASASAPGASAAPAR